MKLYTILGMFLTFSLLIPSVIVAAGRGAGAGIGAVARAARHRSIRDNKKIFDYASSFTVGQKEALLNMINTTHDPLRNIRINTNGEAEYPLIHGLVVTHEIDILEMVFKLYESTIKPFLGYAEVLDNGIGKIFSHVLELAFGMEGKPIVSVATLLELLLKYGADPNLSAPDNRIPLIFRIISLPHIDVAEKIKILNLLCAYGAKVTDEYDAYAKAVYGTLMKSSIPDKETLCAWIKEKNPAVEDQWREEPRSLQEEMNLVGAGIASLAQDEVAKIEQERDSAKSTGIGEAKEEKEAEKARRRQEIERNARAEKARLQKEREEKERLAAELRQAAIGAETAPKKADPKEQKAATVLASMLEVREDATAKAPKSESEPKKSAREETEDENTRSIARENKEEKRDDKGAGAIAAAAALGSDPRHVIEERPFSRSDSAAILKFLSDAIKASPEPLEVEITSEGNVLPIIAALVLYDGKNELEDLLKRSSPKKIEKYINNTNRRIHIPLVGMAPLHIAVVKGNVEMVKLLLSYGADPTIKSSGVGESSLFTALTHMHCIQNPRERLAIVELLYENGGSVCLYECNGTGTSIEKAVRRTILPEPALTWLLEKRTLMERVAVAMGLQPKKPQGIKPKGTVAAPKKEAGAGIQSPQEKKVDAISERDSKEEKKREQKKKQQQLEEERRIAKEQKRKKAEEEKKQREEEARKKEAQEKADRERKEAERAEQKRKQEEAKRKKEQEERKKEEERKAQEARQKEEAEKRRLDKKQARKNKKSQEPDKGEGAGSRVSPLQREAEGKEGEREVPERQIEGVQLITGAPEKGAGASVILPAPIQAVIQEEVEPGAASPLSYVTGDPSMMQDPSAIAQAIRAAHEKSDVVDEDPGVPTISVPVSAMGAGAGHSERSAARSGYRGRPEFVGTPGRGPDDKKGEERKEEAAVASSIYAQHLLEAGIQLMSGEGLLTDAMYTTLKKDKSYDWTDANLASDAFPPAEKSLLKTIQEHMECITFSKLLSLRSKEKDPDVALRQLKGSGCLELTEFNWKYVARYLQQRVYS